MSKFKQTDFKISEEKAGAEKAQILKVNAPQTPGVGQFQTRSFDQKGTEKYAQVKAKYGALAVTDSDRKVKAGKDSRFSINPLLRDTLSVEEEERRAIDERVKERVVALSAEVTKKAEAVGYQAGLKKGYDEAFASFKAEGEHRLTKFAELLDAAEGAKEQIFKSNERFLIELVYKIARMILLRELKTDKEHVVRVAREIIERVGVRDNITIRISEEDAETAGMLKEGLEATLGGLKNLNVQVSNQVHGGGCVVETEWNAIDASIDTQLAGLYESLTGGTASGV